MTGPGVHLCGSVPLPDAESVFRLASARLDGLLERIPDGETGERGNWVMWQLPKLQNHPDLELATPPNPDAGPMMRLSLRPGADAAAVEFADLGYTTAAKQSWAVFSRLRAEGVIPAGVRFQVSLPTPVAVVCLFIATDQDELERAYEARLLAELAEIAAVVPAEDLAIQWDVAAEFALLEYAVPAWLPEDYQEREAALVQRLIRLGSAVPNGVQLGYHLCYGDFEHRHFVEPADTGKLAAVAGQLLARVPRQVDWVHLPVPRERDDAAYFAPLAQLEVPAATTLYLGLVHATDGEEGGRRRINAARAVQPVFGIATECGMGRRPPEQIPGLFDLHAALARELS
jgi:hypothetical protein